MKAKLKVTFFYWLIWVLIFQLARLAFSLYNIEETSSQQKSELLLSFFYGMRMDISMASYILIPFCTFQILALFVKSFSPKKIYLFYSAIVLLPVLLIVFCDMPAYKAWGYRLDTTPLKYLKTPAEAWASVSNLPVLRISILFILSYLMLIRFFKIFLHRNSAILENNDKKYFQLLMMIPLTVLQIIPIRGGLQLAPLNQSSVYFSSSNYLNLTAINATWNFGHSITNQGFDNQNPFQYLSHEIAESYKNSLYKQNSNQIALFDSVQKTNVIIIVWESFSKKIVDIQKNGIFITPGFNRLKEEGIYFSDIYATGDRTDKGIVGVLSGYPAQPTASIVTIPQKASKLPNLALIFGNKGYDCSFYYGGDHEFANMKAYLYSCQYQHYISKKNFDEKDCNSGWGAHDHVVKEKLLQDLRIKKSPFFITWLTLSSHQPFETPVKTVIEGQDDESLFLNSHHYTDSTIFSFIEQCKKEAFWKNTVVIIVGDHGNKLPRTEKRIEDYKIPMLWLGGAIKDKAFKINSTGSQIDIASTLLEQLHYESDDFIWSKNLLTVEPKPWAYFSFNNGFGFVENNQYLIFDNVGKTIIEKSGNISDSLIDKGKSIEQLSFGDYLSK